MLTKFERKTLHPLLQYCQELLLLMEEIPLFIISKVFYMLRWCRISSIDMYQLIQPRERNLPPESRGKSCRIVILNRTPQAPPQHTATTQNEPPKNDKAPTHQPHQNEFPNKIRKDQTKTEVELTLTANSCVSLHHHAMAACQGAIRQRPSITRTIFDVLHGATCVTTWTLLVSSENTRLTRSSLVPYRSQSRPLKDGCHRWATYPRAERMDQSTALPW